MPALPAYQAVVVRVIDGDTLAVRIDAWSNTPFGTPSVRVYGIDTPEDRKPPAKCKAEVALGRAAQTFARTLVQPGATVTVIFHGIDKYGGRIDADVTLPDGRDWGAVMLEGGYAHTYTGATKITWCKRRNDK